MTYYDKEFKQLDIFPAKMKLTNNFGETTWISVSPGEIKAILAILNRKEVEA